MQYYFLILYEQGTRTVLETRSDVEPRLCMYVRSSHTYRKSMDQPGNVANPARGQLNSGY